jgi:hypothetical protein
MMISELSGAVTVPGAASRRWAGDWPSRRLMNIGQGCEWLEGTATIGAASSGSTRTYGPRASTMFRRVPCVDRRDSAAVGQQGLLLHIVSYCTLSA